MPKKPARNAFYFYMQEIMPQLQREGRVFPNGMADVVPVAHPRWKALPENEKERFEQIAKDYKAKMRGTEGDRFRLDNVGNILSERKDPKTEYDRQRASERKKVKSRWPAGRDVIYEKFYFIEFQYLCETEDGDFLPCEIGLLEYSLNSGITKTLHRFIEPGKIPTGYRFTCQSHSDDTHQIPIENFEHADDNYRGLWIQLENFLNPNGEQREYPPLYCISTSHRMVQYCLDWIHARACLGIPSRLKKLYELDGLVVDLFAHSDGTVPIKANMTSMLTTSAFDYEPNTRCFFHEEIENKHCALGICRRFSYAMSDAFSDVYHFELTSSHVPTKSNTEPAFTVISPSAIAKNNRPIRNRPDEDKFSSPSRGRGRNMATEEEDNGPFASRDFRYSQKNKFELDETEDYDDPPQVQQTIRRPNMPGAASQINPGQGAPPAPWGRGTPINQGPAPWAMAAQRAAGTQSLGVPVDIGPTPAEAKQPQPWASQKAPTQPPPWVQKPAAQPTPTQPSPAWGAQKARVPTNTTQRNFNTDLEDADEFPALGGKAPPPAKFAMPGRVNAPPPEEAPKPPAAWSGKAEGEQDHTSQDRQELPFELVQNNPKPKQNTAAPRGPPPGAWGMRGPPQRGTGQNPWANAGDPQQQLSKMFQGVGRGRGRGSAPPPTVPGVGVPPGFHNQGIGRGKPVRPGASGGLNNQVSAMTIED